jgi:uncharacterized protein with von Willebrand factor type A (vWA) domain
MTLEDLFSVNDDVRSEIINSNVTLRNILSSNLDILRTEGDNRSFLDRLSSRNISGGNFNDSNLVNSMQDQLRFFQEESNRNTQNQINMLRRLDEVSYRISDSIRDNFQQHNTQDEQRHDEELDQERRQSNQLLGAMQTTLGLLTEKASALNGHVESQIDKIYEIRNILGLSGPEWDAYQKALDKNTLSLNKSYNNLFSQNDKLDTMKDLADIGVRSVKEA